MFKTLMKNLRTTVLALTCHHTIYGAMAVTYGAKWFHLATPDTLYLTATALYLVLAVRG